MPYSELIKSFDKIRDYMREFYVYGFKSRTEYDAKSARGYDNERRRIESWMGEYMGFRHNAAGKNVFISVDSRGLANNPLHKAFKAKSFTRNDIALHFFLLDILADGAQLTVQQLIEQITSDYLTHFEQAEIPDESTVRKKLKEYTELGLLSAETLGKRQYYQRSPEETDLSRWSDAIAFYSEVDSLGVIGSYLLDKFPESPQHFRFKHHYLLHTLESEVLLSILRAIRARCNIEIQLHKSLRLQDPFRHLMPLKILASAQTGRYYLCAYSAYHKSLWCYRLDHIQTIRVLEEEPRFDEYQLHFAQAKRHLWGASVSPNRRVDHIEMTLWVGANEEYISRRLMRERRCGTVEQIDDVHWRFSADVYDPVEMIPWLRTFIGRIVDLQCTNPHVTERFYTDVRAMAALYTEENP